MHEMRGVVCALSEVTVMWPQHSVQSPYLILYLSGIMLCWLLLVWSPVIKLLLWRG